MYADFRLNGCCMPSRVKLPYWCLPISGWSPLREPRARRSQTPESNLEFRSLQIIRGICVPPEYSIEGIIFGGGISDGISFSSDNAYVFLSLHAGHRAYFAACFVRLSKRIAVCLPILKKADSGNIISWHDTIEDIMLILHIGSINCEFAEPNKLLVKQDVFTSLVESRTSINCLGIIFIHGLRSTLWPEDTFVVSIGKFLTEVLIEVVRVYLLQAHNIGIYLLDVIQNFLLACWPGQG